MVGVAVVRIVWIGGKLGRSSAPLLVEW